jgi:hypothetical protein
MVGTRGLQRGRLCLAAIVVASAAALASTASASAAVSARDRQATLAYLQAKYQYEVAYGEAAKASIDAAAAFAGRLEAECRNAVAGLPVEGIPLINAVPRVRGEADRLVHERGALKLELDAGLDAPLDSALAAPVASFQAAVAPLRWSDPRIATAVSAYATYLQPPPVPRPGPPEACADLRSWAQSGYRHLPERAKALLAAEDARFESGLAGPSADTLLKPYEGAAERALAKRTVRVEAAAARFGVEQLGALDSKLGEAVGFRLAKSLRPTKVTTLAAGTTHSGLGYRVTAETPLEFHEPGCRLQVTVGFLPPNAAGESVIIVGTSSPGLCVAGRAIARSPELECEDGSLTIVQALDARARTVRLRLADGRSLSSRAIVLRPPHGAPARLYVQAVGRLSSAPVSLTELDASGSVLAMRAIPKHSRCPRVAPEEPLAVPLAKGLTPRGNAFTIEALGFIGGEGPQHASLFVRAGSEDSSDVSFGHGGLSRVFGSSLRDGCEPGEWSLVYGMLKGPATSVTATTPGGEVALTTVRVPAGLHLGGTVLAYGAFAGLPSELSVRDAGGRVLGSESLGEQASEHRQYCEGYVEP